MRSLALLAALLVSSQAQAYGPCDADAEKLCAEAHGGETVKVCLHKNADKVTRECGAFLKSQEKSFQDREQSLGEVRKACGEDIEKLCPEAQASDKPLTVCLMGHGEKLKKQCRDDLNRHIKNHLPGIREIGSTPE